MLSPDRVPLKNDPAASQPASPLDLQDAKGSRKRWRDMTKDERNDYIKRNPRVMYAWLAAFCFLLCLINVGLAQVQDQPAYLTYDKSTRPLIWAGLTALMVLYFWWKAWRSPRGNS